MVTVPRMIISKETNCYKYCLYLLQEYLKRPQIDIARQYDVSKSTISNDFKMLFELFPEICRKKVTYLLPNLTLHGIKWTELNNLLKSKTVEQVSKLYNIPKHKLERMKYLYKELREHRIYIKK